MINTNRELKYTIYIDCSERWNNISWIKGRCVLACTTSRYKYENALYIFEYGFDLFANKIAWLSLWMDFMMINKWKSMIWFRSEKFYLDSIQCVLKQITNW